MPHRILPPAFFLLLAAGCVLAAPAARAGDLADFSRAVVLTRPGELPAVEETAAVVLVEEVEKRTGLRLERATDWPADDRPVIVVAAPEKGKVRGWARPLPVRKGKDLPERRTDGYRLLVEPGRGGAAPVLWALGADPRGALYAVGALLRHADCSEGGLALPPALDLATAPASPIRGHQLGYRSTANSWDAWDAAGFDRYIRELAFFGVNAIENIPFQDSPSPVMKVGREEMNVRMSEICARYGLEYWIWAPATFDLGDTEKRDALLAEHDALYAATPRLDGVFFPGGDPGDNPPDKVLAFLEDLSKVLKRRHPEARIWLSLQGFDLAQTGEVLDHLTKHTPSWLGGLCGGPSSPPIPLLRNRLPERYGLRMYPDITHNKLCQYPVHWWDQAYALTLGREAINPRPEQYAYIHNWFAPYCDGFITYSDGVHDDLNKTVWSALGWDPATPVRDILTQYARVYFGAADTERAADGILALENNWRGSLAMNGAVNGTLRLWQELERDHPERADNWRWQMCLVRAHYDAFVRARLLNETALEREANAALLEAEVTGPESAMARALEILRRAETQPAAPELRGRIVRLYDDLYRSIGLQSSVEQYFASGAERGASLDFIDIPLNNRWWLEDEFAKVAAMSSEKEKVARLREIALWEDPGPGGFYDDIGHTARSPRIQRAEVFFSDPAEEARPEPLFWWLDNGKCRQRLSWQVTMDWPEAAVYEGLDPKGDYVVRTCGYGQEVLLMDGARVASDREKTEIGEVRAYRVPKESVKDRKLVVTWKAPAGEESLGWRQRSRVAEIWLVKK